MIEDNYFSIIKEIKETAESCSRLMEDISLVAVSKSKPWDLCAQLYNLKVLDFGENRVHEALDKISLAPKNCRWHFVGNIQTKMIKKIVSHFSLIHSVSHLDIAEKISICSESLGVITPILLQTNTSRELTKQGFSVDSLKRDYFKALKFKGIKITGLMTMAPLTEDQNIIRPCFALLRELLEDIQKELKDVTVMKELSMGMSHDFKLAILEGATILRIGSALFQN